MAFTTSDKLKGPAGDAGVDGLGYVDADVVGNHLVVTDSKAATHDVGLVSGPDGLDGADAELKGSVAAFSDLAPLVATSDEGDAYLLESDGHLYRFDGTQFLDVGELRGPMGSSGANGQGGVRGRAWKVGVGAPPADPDAQFGDRYLDISTGEIYRFSGNGNTVTEIGVYRGAGFVYVARRGMTVAPPRPSDTRYRVKSGTSVQSYLDAPWVFPDATNYGILPYPLAPPDNTTPVIFSVEATTSDGNVTQLGPFHAISRPDDGNPMEAMEFRLHPIAGGFKFVRGKNFPTIDFVQIQMFDTSDFSHVYTYILDGPNFDEDVVGLPDGKQYSMQFTFATPHGTVDQAMVVIAGEGNPDVGYRPGMLGFDDINIVGDGAGMLFSFHGEEALGAGTRRYEWRLVVDAQSGGTTRLNQVAWQPTTGGALPFETLKDSTGANLDRSKIYTASLRVTEGDGFVYEMASTLAQVGVLDPTPPPGPDFHLVPDRQSMQIILDVDPGTRFTVVALAQDGSGRSYGNGYTSSVFPYVLGGLTPGTDYNVTVTYYALGYSLGATRSARTSA